MGKRLIFCDWSEGKSAGAGREFRAGEPVGENRSPALSRLQHELSLNQGG